MDPLLTERSAEEVDRIPEPDQGTGRETQHKHTHVDQNSEKRIAPYYRLPQRSGLGRG